MIVCSISIHKYYKETIVIVSNVTFRIRSKDSKLVVLLLFVVLFEHAFELSFGLVSSLSGFLLFVLCNLKCKQTRMICKVFQAYCCSKIETLKKLHHVPMSKPTPFDGEPYF